MCHRMARAALVEVMNPDHVRSVALMVTNVILVETAFNLPGFFRQADVGQFLGELGHLPSPDVMQALMLEAATLISVTMLITDLLHARLDPQVRTLR
jgi:ABC-type dipeptide/oligopeptide/nickel transport system permease component